MAIINRMGIANDYGFQRKVKYCMQKSAIDVLGEATPIGDEHTARAVYARSVLSGAASVYEFAVGVVTNATIAGYIDNSQPIPDNDIQFAVNSMFSDYAGWDAP